MKEGLKNDPLRGTFPERWATVPFGALFRESHERNGGNIVGEALSVSEYRGVVPRDVDAGQMESEDVSNYRVVRPGQLAVNVMWLNRTGLGVSDYTGYVSPAYKVFTINRSVEPRFADFVLRSSVFRSAFERLGRGVRPNAQMVDTAELRHLPFPLPSLTQQRAIADFLDRETARIDTLIAKQEQLIATLRERRDAVLESALLDLSWATPLRSSVTLIQTGPFGSQLKSDEYEVGGVPVINPSHMHAGRIKPDTGVAVSARKAGELSRHEFHLGDVIVARRGELGRCAVVSVDAVGYLCGTGSAIVRPQPERLDSTFLALAYQTRRNKDSLALASVGSTMANVNSAIIGALRLPLPPLSEQRRLVAVVAEQTAKIDALIEKTERFISLSKERRSALITAAVTGQLDVCGEVA